MGAGGGNVSVEYELIGEPDRDRERFDPGLAVLDVEPAFISSISWRLAAWRRKARR